MTINSQSLNLIIIRIKWVRSILLVPFHIGEVDLKLGILHILLVDHFQSTVDRSFGTEVDKTAFD